MSHVLAPKRRWWPGLIGATSPVRALKGVAKEIVLAAQFAQADAFVASYPKSGRTWLRFILVNYLDELLQLGLNLNLRTMFQLIPNDTLDPERGAPAYRFRRRGEVPFLVMTHGRPKRLLLRRKPILLLTREPKDTLVSHYFHLAHRNHDIQPDLKAFLRSSRAGVAALCRYYNGWAAGIRRYPSMLLGYERLRREPAAAMTDVLGFLGIPVEQPLLRRSIEASSLNSMRRLEVRFGMPDRNYDRSNQDSLRVRRGKVGGHADHLDDEEIAFIDRVCASMLSPAAQRLLANVAPPSYAMPAAHRILEPHGA